MLIERGMKLTLVRQAELGHFLDTIPTFHAHKARNEAGSSQTGRTRPFSRYRTYLSCSQSEEWSWLQSDRQNSAILQIPCLPFMLIKRGMKLTPVRQAELGHSPHGHVTHRVTNHTHCSWWRYPNQCCGSRSGIQAFKTLDLESGILVGKNPDPRSGINISDHISESLVTI